eukprot:gnl/TRDRNA2_/TRDRNA2_117287_c0_seq1.p1 gnl/TRDRNA2_/TRDRNA2_117287_c0~~gnl/TRDRNA2_/TRDRNA2_117287_c0_seq1.p1  ORF type:complete len:175 (+),score=16.56 gnl/TRDRNA2_/TRDRNA2_117287_c0_seq1:226-750(+)
MCASKQMQNRWSARQKNTPGVMSRHITFKASDILQGAVLESRVKTTPEPPAWQKGETIAFHQFTKLPKYEKWEGPKPTEEQGGPVLSIHTPSTAHLNKSPWNAQGAGREEQQFPGGFKRKLVRVIEHRRDKLTEHWLPCVLALVSFLFVALLGVPGARRRRNTLMNLEESLIRL